jgi:hypothetical protein
VESSGFCEPCHAANIAERYRERERIEYEARTRAWREWDRDPPASTQTDGQASAGRAGVTGGRPARAWETAGFQRTLWFGARAMLLHST